LEHQGTRFRLSREEELNALDQRGVYNIGIPVVGGVADDDRAPAAGEAAEEQAEPNVHELP
jgi:uncharacterized protein YraI